VAHGLVYHYDRSMLPKHGGSLNLTRGWAQSMMQRMNYSRRVGTQAARKLPDNYEELKRDFLDRIANTVKEHKIPDQLIINYDQTGVNIVPTSNWTMHDRGAKQTKILGLQDKRQITVLMGCTMAGKLMPPQVVYAGKTDACHPKFDFPREWDITHTESHWSKDTTMIEYFDQVLFPYIDRTIGELDLPVRQRALVVMDMYKAHRVPAVIDYLKSNKVEIVYVPGGCTGELQPLDLSGNNNFKQHIRKNFNQWHVKKVSEQLRRGRSCKVDLRLSVVKPLHARWLVAAMETLASNQPEILLGWQKSGILEAVQAARNAD